MIKNSNGNLNEQTIKELSWLKGEPKWMLDFRLNSLKQFKKAKLPKWGPNLKDIDFSKINYYIKHPYGRSNNWENVPKKISNQYAKLGLMKAEREFLAGVNAQFESEVLYKNLKDKLSKKGVLFEDTDTALKKFPELFKLYFAKIVPPSDNKFSALNSAFWSGGSFVFVPKGVEIQEPLQAFFLINAKNIGQFERTLIILEKNSSVHYVEGCTAPQYKTYSLHSAVVEVFVNENARAKYSTVQNWSKNIFNLTTKRAKLQKNAKISWVDANFGSKITMKYPGNILEGENSSCKILSLTFASQNQIIDSGANIFHLGKNTSSRIVSKSISDFNGESNFRSKVKIANSAKNAKSLVTCSSLLINNKSIAKTYPKYEICNSSAKVEHEAFIENLSEEKLFFLQTRGMSKEDAKTLLLSNFIDPVVEELPMEFAVEMNRLIKIQIDSSIG